MRVSTRNSQDEKARQRRRHLLLLAVGFVLGFVVAIATILNTEVFFERLEHSRSVSLPSNRDSSSNNPQQTSKSDGGLRMLKRKDALAGVTYHDDPQVSSQPMHSMAAKSTSLLQGVRILVAIAAFDFNQIPHLEEVLDSYHDICVGGAKVDVVLHASVAYPVTLIDLLNSRFTCSDFSVKIVLKPSSLRLHFADVHRELFYENINAYDLFIYTEEDIQVKPGTVSTYLEETQRIKKIMDQDKSSKYSFSDFNVGIVRYEYNYPSNVVIDDKTRHAIQNVTRVYWEHSSNKPPLIPNTVNVVPIGGEGMAERYMTMANHHQGMFLATPELLLAWKDRKNCKFDVIKNRPGTASQPSAGTQRVWMSSNQLFGKRHCNVQQVLPKEKFGALTVLHVPNKNYRRVGKYRKRVFSDGTEQFEKYPDLLTAMKLHLAMRKAWPGTPQKPYKGPVKMIDEVTKAKDRTPTLERRLREYHDYANRGGILSEYDFTRTQLVETD